MDGTMLRLSSVKRNDGDLQNDQTAETVCCQIRGAAVVCRLECFCVKKLSVVINAISDRRCAAGKHVRLENSRNHFSGHVLDHSIQSIVCQQGIRDTLCRLQPPRAKGSCILSGTAARDTSIATVQMLPSTQDNGPTQLLSTLQSNNKAALQGNFLQSPPQMLLHNLVTTSSLHASLSLALLILLLTLTTLSQQPEMTSQQPQLELTSRKTV